MVNYENVHKAFDSPVLAGVNLQVAPGETMAVVGHSGTGKSVLLKTTIGLITPDYGDVKIAGKSVFFSDRKTIETLRRKAGYVFQNAALFDSMTVFENVSQGIPEDQLKKMRFRDALKRVAESLEHVNLEPRAVLSKLPAELSGGMRKRVGLARAIVGNPEILLYDEPVTGLDPVNGAIVHQLIARLGKELELPRSSSPTISKVRSQSVIASPCWTMEESALLERLMNSGRATTRSSVPSSKEML